jgi:hypothetical protein
MNTTPLPASKRLSHLKGRSDTVDVRLDEHGRRITVLESGVIDLRLAMAQVHGDLKINNVTTEAIQKSVSSIESDTREMIAVYRATPKMREDMRFWVWVAGAAWATVLAVATVYGAFFQ